MRVVIVMAAQRRAPLVALLSDFGTQDWYVACMKAVILSRCPGAQLVDITHEIPAQDVIAGACTLAASFPWFPSATVFLCVVDPGVGSARPLIAVRAGGRVLVGPDNGLLGLVLAQTPRPRIVRLTERRFWLPRPSRTFHGRDILAPVAAALARGAALERFGPPTTRFQPLSLPVPRRRGRRVSGCIVHIDRFGNLLTNLPAQLAATTAGRPTIRFGRREARVVSSYAEGRYGELLALVGSSGYLELAMRDGSAAKRLRARRGAALTLEERARRSDAR